MLVVITGCMFSGKTDTLIRKINSYKIKDKKVAVITHFIDDRDLGLEEETKNKLYSRDGSSVDITFKVKKLSELEGKLKEYDVIALDEGHFFEEDLVDWCEYLTNKEDKIVIISGLNSNYKREEFSNMTRLLSKYDKIIPCYAICIYCKKKASFTRKKENDNKIIDVGGSDKYEPVCRKCYNKKIS
jgi:thymidine kinase